MKANEMPERIFIFDYNDAMVTPLEGDTVYVRKDAFIEKAAKWIEEHEGMYEAFDTDSRTYYSDTESMIKDFKKAMKLWKY